MTTLSQLLNHPKLPSEIRHEILAEMERQGISQDLCKYDSLADFIYYEESFVWWNSNKGFNYWNRTRLSLKALGI